MSEKMLMQDVMDAISIKDELQSIKDFVRYMELHQARIQCAWRRMQILCQDVYFFQQEENIKRMQIKINQHDISKLDAKEFTAYRNRRTPTKWLRMLARMTGKTTKELVEKEFNVAKNQHVKGNFHHWESWAVYKVDSLTFNQKYFCMIEMICDWMAVGMEKQNTALEFYNKHPEIFIPKDIMGDFRIIIERVSHYDYKRL